MAKARQLKPRRGDRVEFVVDLDGHERKGQTVDGTVTMRKRDGTIVVEEMHGMKRGAENAGGGRTYEIETTQWTVPTSVDVKITRRSVRFGELRRQQARKRA